MKISYVPLLIAILPFFINIFKFIRFHFESKKRKKSYNKINKVSFK